MPSENQATQLLNSLMKGVSEKQWETYKRKRRPNNLIISEVISDAEGEEIDVISDSELTAMASEVQLSQPPVNSDVLIKQYMDNEISFDELANVMEKQIQDKSAETTDLSVIIENFEQESSTEDEEEEEGEEEADDNVQSGDSELAAECSRGKRKAGKYRDSGRTKGRRSKLPRDLMSLVGQANLYFAQGQHDDAIAMCSEVIRQVPTAPEPFQTLGMLYEEMGQIEKAFQYNLIAAYLCPSDGEHWTKVAEMAIDQNKLPLAIKCLSKAIRINPGNLEIHLQRCHLYEKTGDLKKALDGYSTMLKELKSAEGEYALILAKEIAKIHFHNEEIDKSLEVMESTFIKFHDLATIEDVNLYLELLIITREYLKSLKCFHDYCEVKFYHNDELIADFSQSHWETLATDKIRIELPTEFVAIDLRSKLVVCLINLQCLTSVKSLIKEITNRSAEEMDDLYLDIADAYTSIGLHKEAEPLLAALVSMNNSPARLWLRYARCLKELGKLEEAISAYREVTRRDSNDHEAKLELTELLIRIGRSEDATNASDQDNSALVNTELLKMRCNLLYEQEMWKDFVQAAKTLLKSDMEFLTHDKELSIMTGVGNFVRKLENLANVRANLSLENIERADFQFIGQRLKFNEFIEIFLRLARVVHEKLNDRDELVRLSLSLFTSPFSKEHPQFLEFFALMGLFEARDDKYIYNTIRSAFSRDNYCNIKNNQMWNLFAAIINIIYQDLRHHRYCLRLLIKDSESLALSYLNGHNALASGSYKYALGEYFNIHKSNPTDSLAIFCLAITLLHLSSQKFNCNQHSTVIQMTAFLNMYLQERGECSEVFYNIGRAYHQLNLLNEAKHFYTKALECTNSIECQTEEEKARFDLKREIAYNLSLIYKECGSNGLALHCLSQYFVV